MSCKQDIKSLDQDTLKSALRELGQPAFRLKQIERWLWVDGASSFEEMTNLPLSLRNALSSAYRLDSPRLATRQVSGDGTRKYLFEFPDGTTVETVGIPSADESRLTVCFSTQAGCAMACAFCATGQSGFSRNLSAGEMFDQVKLVEHDFGKRVSNVVAMGQGEPFENYEACLRALRRMNSKTGLGIGARHITVSTCGIVKQILRFAEEPEQFTLAVSLHSAKQETRNALMPGTRGNPLKDLRDALKYYGDHTKRRPTLEYALIDGVNDDDEHLESLIRFCRSMLCHVNLIPLNPITPNANRGRRRPYPSSRKEPGRLPDALAPSCQLEPFRDALIDAGIECSIRISRGGDIDGACGQLRQRMLR